MWSFHNVYIANCHTAYFTCVTILFVNYTLINLEKNQCFDGYRPRAPLGSCCPLCIPRGCLFFQCSYLHVQSQQGRIFPCSNLWISLTLTSRPRFKGLMWLHQAHLDNLPFLKPTNYALIIQPYYRTKIHHFPSLRDYTHGVHQRASSWGIS